MSLRIRLHEMKGYDGPNIPEEELWQIVYHASTNYGLRHRYDYYDNGWIGFVLATMEKYGVREVLDNTDKYFPMIAEQIETIYKERTHYGEPRLFKDVSIELFRYAKSVMSQVLRGLKKEKIVYKPQATYPRSPISYTERRAYNTGRSYTTAIFYDDPNDDDNYARVSIVWYDSYPSVIGAKQPTELRATLPLQVLATDKEGKQKYISIPLIVTNHCGTVEPPKGYDGYKDTFKLLGGMELYNVASDYKVFCEVNEYGPKNETTPQGFVDYVKTRVEDYLDVKFQV